MPDNRGVNDNERTMGIPGHLIGEVVAASRAAALASSKIDIKSEKRTIEPGSDLEVRHEHAPYPSTPSPSPRGGQVILDVAMKANYELSLAGGRCILVPYREFGEVRRRVDRLRFSWMDEFFLFAVYILIS